jgi:aminomethyltransferase
VKESTDELHNISVQGPASRDILSQIVWTAPGVTPFAELKWFRFAVARIDGPQGIPIVASRTGYSGELGYELFCHPKDAPALWDRVLEVGSPAGLTPLGLDALDVLRIEAGLVFPGYEFDDQVDPFEAGIGFVVTPDKEDDFVGKTALAERRAHPQRVLVGLELEGNEHLRRQVAAPEEEPRVLPARRAVLGAGHRGRGGEARRAHETHSGDRGAVSVLRPGEDATTLLEA